MMINILSLDICNNANALNVFKFLGFIFIIIKILIPILIIILGSIDLLKQVINPDNNKNIKMFLKRIIIGIAVFFIASIITLIFDLINVNTNNKCFDVFLNPDEFNIGDMNNIDIDSSDEIDIDKCEDLGEPYIWQNNECVIDMSKNKLK